MCGWRSSIASNGDSCIGNWRSLEFSPTSDVGERGFKSRIPDCVSGVKSCGVRRSAHEPGTKQPGKHNPQLWGRFGFESRHEHISNFENLSSKTLVDYKKIYKISEQSGYSLVGETLALGARGGRFDSDYPDFCKFPLIYQSCLQNLWWL